MFARNRCVEEYRSLLFFHKSNLVDSTIGMTRQAFLKAAHKALQCLAGIQPVVHAVNSGRQQRQRQILLGQDFDGARREVLHLPIRKAPQMRRPHEHHAGRRDRFIRAKNHECIPLGTYLLLRADSLCDEQIRHRQVSAMKPLGMLQQKQIRRQRDDIVLLNRELRCHAYRTSVAAPRESAAILAGTASM